MRMYLVMIVRICRLESELLDHRHALEHERERVIHYVTARGVRMH